MAYTRHQALDRPNLERGLEDAVIENFCFVRDSRGAVRGIGSAVVERRPFKLGTFEIEGAPAVGIVRGVPYLFLKPSRGAVIGNGDSILLPYGRSQID